MVPTTADAVLAFIAAAAIAWLLVPLAERLAFRVGAIDIPQARSLHDRPMPRLSGLAILVAVEVSGWIWLPDDGQSRSILIGAIAIPHEPNDGAILQPRSAQSWASSWCEDAKTA